MTTAAAAPRSRPRRSRLPRRRLELARRAQACGQPRIARIARREVRVDRAGARRHRDSAVPRLSASAKPPRGAPEPRWRKWRKWRNAPFALYAPTQRQKGVQVGADGRDGARSAATCGGHATHDRGRANTKGAPSHGAGSSRAVSSHTHTAPIHGCKVRPRLRASRQGPCALARRGLATLNSGARHVLGLTACIRIIKACRPRSKRGA